MPQTEENKTGAEQKAPDSTSAPSTPAGNTPPSEPTMMQVPVDKMQQMLDRMEALEQRDKERDEQMEILRDSVSRGKLEEAEGKRKKKGPPTAKVMIHAGKVVSGWKMVTNEMVYDPRNLQVPAGEKLQIKLLYPDGGESQVMQYVDFVRNLDRATVTKVGDNGIMWIVTFDDPSVYEGQLEIDPQFLNP